MKKRKLFFSICAIFILLICFVGSFFYLSKLESECEKYEFDKNGNLIFYYSGKEKGGTKQYLKYNDNNQEIESKVFITNPYGVSEVMTKTIIYDEEGLLKNNVITWTTNDKVTRTSEEEYFYNEKNQLVKQISSSGNEYIYEYDEMGHKKI